MRPSLGQRIRCFIGLLLLAAAGQLLAQTSYVNFEGKQTSPIRLSPDGSRLFAVNTPDARLSVFDVSNPSNPILIAEIPVGLEPVSVNPLSNDEAWVVNEVSDSISIVSVSRALVADTIYLKDEPADVVFAGGKAFVSVGRRNLIAVFDAASHAAITNIAVFGENPRALAVGPAGTNVYAAFALSGDRTTLIPANLAPPQSPQSNSPPQVGLIVDAADPAWSGTVQYTIPDNDVVEIGVSSLAVTRYYARVGTVNLGLAVRPTNGDLFVANADAANLTHFEPGVRGHFYTNRISRITVSDGTITPFDLDPFATTNFPDLFSRSNALAQPTALVFEPGGNYFWLAAFGTDRVARLDTSGNVVARIEIGSAAGATADPRNKRGPRGLALKAAASRLYVLNRISNTLCVVDTANNSVLRELPVGSYDPTPQVVRQGRGFLYDAKLSGNGTVSCASCHIDAEMDLIAWDLGNPAGNADAMTAKISGTPFMTNFVFHPMKGPMTTQTLRGLSGLDPLHWRGDRTNFLQFKGAFDGLLGGTVLADADMQAYADFIHTVRFQPNPNQNLDRTLPASFAGGNPVQGLFTFTNEFYQGSEPLGLRCNSCHTLPNGTDKSFTPAAALMESQSFKVPHLRAIYQKLSLNKTPGAQSIGGFGFIHDGTFADILSFLSQPVFGSFATDATRKANLNAFVQCFDTGTAPAVGYTRTITVTNLASATNDWALLEGQAVAANIDLVVKGTLDGQIRGLLYQPASNNYVSDKTGVGPFTRAQLIAKIQAGDVLSPMGVPPGSGRRLGIDRDQDGVLDCDAVPPSLQLTRASAELLFSWSTNSLWFVLEAATSLSPGAWTPVTELRSVTGDQVIVTNSITGNSRFYRLRRPW